MRIQMKLNNRLFAVDIKENDNDTYEDIISKAHDKIAEQIALYNEKESIIFYDELEPVCSECGISLNLDEEKEDFKCLHCSNKKSIKILNVKEDDEITDVLDREGYEWIVED